MHIKKSIAAICLSFACLTSFAMEGGLVANPNTYPGQVMISFNRLVTNLLVSPLKRCSAIVLDKRHVLTSASCVYFLDTSTSPDSFKTLPPSALYVHPSSNGRVGYSTTSFPVISPSDQPNIRVISFVSHPKLSPHNPPFYSPPGKYSHNLVILKLIKDINVAPATLYHGKNKFLGTSAIAMGWDKESIRIQTSPFTSSFRYYFQQEQYNTTILLNPPSAGEPCRNTLFCSGFSSSNKNLNSSYDEGAPMWRTVNAKKVIIGLAADASNGTTAPYIERYGHINSSVYDFIRQHVPNTKFWSEEGLTPVFENTILPILNLLLLDD